MPGVLITEQTFRVVASRAWVAFGHDSDNFKCSNKFIDGFKHRNDLSSRRFHAKRRDPEASKDDIAAWVAQIQALLEDNAHDLVVNCDETAWTVIPSGLLVWAPVGADGVTVNTNANDKECVAVLASTTAAGNKLPLFAIAQGKTKKVERTQLGSDETLVCAHSTSGWTTIAQLGFRPIYGLPKGAQSDADSQTAVGILRHFCNRPKLLLSHEEISGFQLNWQYIGPVSLYADGALQKRKTSGVSTRLRSSEGRKPPAAIPRSGGAGSRPEAGS
jgi:hypothetical protein